MASLSYMDAAARHDCVRPTVLDIQCCQILTLKAITMTIKRRDITVIIQAFPNIYRDLLAALIFTDICLSLQFIIHRE